MNFVLLFEDNAELSAEVRRTHLPAHLAFLKENEGMIVSAGPLAETDGSPAGGIWIVSAASAEAAEALVKQDPFWPTGLRKSVRVLEWRKVFEDGAVFI